MKNFLGEFILYVVTNNETSPTSLSNTRGQRDVTFSISAIINRLRCFPFNPLFGQGSEWPSPFVIPVQKEKEGRCVQILTTELELKGYMGSDHSSGNPAFVAHQRSGVLFKK